MKTSYILISLLLIAASCKIFTEPDLTDINLEIYAPVNGMGTSSRTLTFWWEAIGESEGYNLIIVSPLWDSIESLVLDTNLTTNKFTYTLAPGDYEWGISAYNAFSATDYMVSSFFIDTSSSLVNQRVVLFLPGEDASTNKDKVYFSWDLIDIATYYTFRITYNTWEGTDVISPVLTYADTTSLELDEGVYVWGVKASNDYSDTPGFTTRLLTVDKTAPGKPIITSPSYNGDTLSNDNMILSWNRTTDSLSAVSDSVFVSTDSLFSPQFEPYITITLETEFDIDGFDPGTYFCKVRSFDAAGNIGPVSDTRKFVIDEK